MGGKNQFGWEDGRCKNLGGQEGELAEPNQTIKTMLEEQFEAEQAKKLAENDKEAVDKNETTVLLRSIGMESKKKRKRNEKRLVDDSNDSFRTDSTQSSHVVNVDLLNESIAEFHRLSSPKSSPYKKLRRARESEMEKQIKEILKNKTLYDIFEEAEIRVDADLVEMIQDMSIGLIVHIYCTPFKNFDADYVIKNYRKTFQINKLVATKLYYYLHQIMDSLI
jgi:hypothetical protein